MVLFCFGVWPGCLGVRGQQDWASCPITVVAPHVGLLEAFFFLYVGPPRPIALAPYTKIPVVASMFRATEGIAVPKPTAADLQKAGGGGGGGGGGESATAKLAPPATSSVPTDSEVGGTAGQARNKGSSATTAVKAAIQKHKEDWAASREAGGGSGGRARRRPPIAILPEGTAHNGKAIIRFFPGAFEGGGPVQPVVMSYPHGRFNSAAFLTTLQSHMGLLLLSPWVGVRAHYLPVRHASAEESADAALYAENVRREMAEAAGLPLSSYSAKTLRDELRQGSSPAKAMT